MRLIGCCKDNIEDVLIRFVPSTAAPTQHPLHHHILTFLTGDELDITASVPVSDDRPTQRQRLQADAAVMSADSDRIFSIAPWLSADDENHYVSMITELLSKRRIRGGFQLGRLKGSHFYGVTNTTTYGHKHQSNNFYVDLQRSGDVVYHCYGSECRGQQPLVLGQWCTEFDDMLYSTTMWKPGCKIDASLLHNLQVQAELRTPKKQKQHHQSWWPQLEQVVVRYMSNYFVFVSTPSVYVYQTLDSEGDVQSYVRYDGSKLANLVMPYKWAFKIGSESHLRETMATKVKFVGQPHDDRVAPDQYNLCAGMMPLLKHHKRSLSSADLEELQPILDHIKNSICAGNDVDYNNLLAWMATVVQNPAEKTGWCPVSELAQVLSYCLGYVAFVV